MGNYLTSIAVEGIGDSGASSVEVPLDPGPGLVVIVGRSASAPSVPVAWLAAAAVGVPDVEDASRACAALRDAARAQRAAEREADALAADRVAVLETGLLFHDKHGTQPCPVCMEGVLDDGWAQRARQAMAREQEAVQSLRTARSASFRARQVVAAVVREVPAPPADDAGLATVATARLAHRALSALPADGDDALADHLDASLPRLVNAYSELRAEAFRRIGGSHRSVVVTLGHTGVEDASPVLGRLARDRQVVVFTDDDGVPDAVGADGVDARVVRC